MNQSMNTSLDGEQLANDIWAMFGAAAPVPPDNRTAAPGNQTNGAAQNEMSNIPDLASEILSKLEQKKETAAAHLGISAAEVETMPFDLTALEQAGIFLNVDTTGFSVLCRQLDWQSLGIELPKEQIRQIDPAVLRVRSR